MKPQRQCVACRKMKPKEELFRISYTSEEGAVCDFTGKKRGRGAYICRSIQCLSEAKKRKALSRSLHCCVPSDIFCELERALKEEKHEAEF